MMMVNMLLLTGSKMLKEYGAQAASGLIPFEMKWYKRWLKRNHGTVTLTSGNLVLHRLE